MWELESLIETMHGISIALFMIAALVIAIMESQYSRIPNWTVKLILLAAVFSFAGISTFDMVLRLIVAGAMLLLLVSYQRSATGAGDVKMLIACSLFFNALSFLVSLIVASVAAAIYAVIKRKKTVSYGMFYGPSAIAVILLNLWFV